MEKDFNTHLSLKVDWADLDLFGHVNNVAFFRYMQAARVNYCESIGLSSTDPGANPGFMVASSSCQFRKPLRYPGELQVFTRVDWIRNSSMQLSYLLRDAKSDLIAEGTDVIVVYDHRSKTKINIPPALKESICAIEGHSF
jgi:acyl-CoA thioester hydrolase